MSPHNNSNRSNSTHKPVLVVVAALLLIYAFHPVTALAEDAAAFRARVIKEVLLEVPDLELAKQIAEIRINREFLNQQSHSVKPGPKRESATKIPAESSLPIKQPVQGANELPVVLNTTPTAKANEPISPDLNLQSSKRANDVYVGVGNRVVVGYAYVYRLMFVFHLYPLV